MTCVTPFNDITPYKLLLLLCVTCHMRLLISHIASTPSKFKDNANRLWNIVSRNVVVIHLRSNIEWKWGVRETAAKNYSLPGSRTQLSRGH